MGLDGVELILAVEEKFGIEISDEVAAQMLTVGNMYDCVLGYARSKGQPVDAEAVWKKLQAIIVEQLGVNPKQVHREAHFIHDLGVG